MTTPRYFNGIPIRTIGGEDIEDHQGDFEEEADGRRGIFTVMTDGFTFRQGADIISHMDKRGSIHPRRYVILFDIGYDENVESSFQNVNMIVCEDGPRITLSFPEIGPITGTGAVHNVSKKLPLRLCPTEERGVVTGFCFSTTVLNGTSSQMTSIFTVSPTGDIVFEYPGVGLGGAINQTVTIRQFCVTYDTGKY